MDRYHRQRLLPQVGDAGQHRLGAARVLIIGVGALGTVIAESLARAGVGRIILADRDVVELTNLQRQTLFSEGDVGSPKAVAAAGRLRAINSSIDVRAEVVDIGPDNLERLLSGWHGTTLLIDGTDNAATRYLVNDVAVKRGLPWVYGGCVGVEGRAMAIVPGVTPCLRCVFPEPPTAGEVATCDTSGVLGPAAGLVASAQAAMAVRLLVGQPPPLKLLTIDAWAWRFREIDLSDARRVDCPACGLRRFDFLNAPAAQTATLCGRDSVQVRTHAVAGFSLDSAEAMLRQRFDVERNAYLLKTTLEPGLSLTLFADGRALVHGTADVTLARTVVGRYLG
jgi:adenylyltransferase/sulfurtransferase